LTFVVGSPADVFGPELAQAVDAVLRRRFAAPAANAEEAYRSESVDAAGWRQLQQLASSMLGNSAPQLTSVDAYQAVYLPDGGEQVEHLPIPNAADPLQVGSVPRLLEELHRFAAGASLPTDVLELMQLATHYLEDDEAYEKDLDVQTYVQLMLSAKQAAARGEGLWIVG
jgi:hypothetical protein